MLGDITAPSGGDVTVGGAGAKQNTNSSITARGGKGNNINSLDAFEASFVSAFPETSFSILTSGPAP